MPKLTRTSTIFNLVGQSSMDDALYEAIRDEDVGPPTMLTFLLSIDAYRDMGEPSVITVTVVPGDLLNVGEQPEPRHRKYSEQEV